MGTFERLGSCSMKCLKEIIYLLSLFIYIQLPRVDGICFFLMFQMEDLLKNQLFATHAIAATTSVTLGTALTYPLDTIKVLVQVLCLFLSCSFQIKLIMLQTQFLISVFHDYL